MVSLLKGASRAAGDTIRTPSHCTTELQLLTVILKY
jgi:hypothetical protein